MARRSCTLKRVRILCVKLGTITPKGNAGELSSNHTLPYTMTDNKQADIAVRATTCGLTLSSVEGKRDKIK